MADVLQGLSADELLTVWERGNTLDNTGRAVLLLAHGLKQSPREAARVDIGRRDQILLAMRSKTFGTNLETFLACRQCGEPLEFSLNARQLAIESNVLEDRCLTGDFKEFSMRLPNSDDLRAVATCTTADEASRVLCRRCVKAKNGDGEGELTEDVLQQFSNWMETVSPEIELLLDIDCPACGTHQPAIFDVVSYFWREIESACGHLVREVDALARVYGWSERAIITMSAARRRLYLQAVMD